MGPSPLRGSSRAPKLPPCWFVLTAWMTHRAIHRSTGGRVGLAWPKAGDKLGVQAGKDRSQHRAEQAVILAYIEDGPKPLTLAMNGCAASRAGPGGSTSRHTGSHT